MSTTSLGEPVRADHPSTETNRSILDVREGEIILQTWLPAPPDKNPMFLEKRVYQGSSGKVYPLPFTDRIAETPVDRAWKAIWLENEFLEVLILPEIGGRIHAMRDKTNGYDLLYNQPVIKPALVGLAGPWISGGIEFNWPQHHRPATFLPVEWEVERAADGSVTVWCSDHDPMTRMKGMHGVCLHPGKAFLELKVRAYNRTPWAQTFLWWANAATRVHEAYQSFFPPDVYYVADHARRSMSEYPFCQGRYYGVDYGARARDGVPEGEAPRQFLPPASGGTAPVDYAANNLAFYANIPVPTSYMCMGSREDFFGGYDYRAQAGIVHVANHHVSPGKKQWTWGNHEFGYAWDRNLTVADASGKFAPYIEIMAGVYTDNQPDFSFLQPGETKTWSQYWFPIQQIGPAQHANLDAALSVLCKDGRAQLGLCVTKRFKIATLLVLAKAETIHQSGELLEPGRPILKTLDLPVGMAESDLSISVLDSDSKEIIAFKPAGRTHAAVPPPATEPLAPESIASADELFLTGLHLDQYRHATRSPVDYWREALRRDPMDARCNNAVGLWHLKRGEFSLARSCFQNAIKRLTIRNANPADGEPYYNLGLCLRCLDEPQGAYDAFYKATWNQAWASASFHALAELDCVSKRWASALEHITRALRLDVDNLRARNLKTIILRRLGRTIEADAWLNETLALDRLDFWARHLQGGELACDLQARLDVAHDYARGGFWDEAVRVLETVRPACRDLPDQSWGAGPMIDYTLGWLEEQRGNPDKARSHQIAGAKKSPDYCFPCRLEDIAILQTALRMNPSDSRAPYYLGNLLYDRRRHEEGIELWEQSARLDGSFSIVWRNLGIGYFNVRKDPAKARDAYERAFSANPSDGRLLFERDQLWKRLGEAPARRLNELERHMDLVSQRDDLSLELCALYNHAGSHARAAEWLASRNFQPWEGGEGGPLGQHVRSQLTLGRLALSRGDCGRARECFEKALTSPGNLSEARHLLANQSDVHYWLGKALAGLKELKGARKHWKIAADFKGDFQDMSVRAFSEMTYYSALACDALGESDRARKLFVDLLDYALGLEKSTARIDYFATSLPTMLLFDDDLQARQTTTALFLQAQARLGLGDSNSGIELLKTVLHRDPNHAAANDLLREWTSTSA